MLTQAAILAGRANPDTRVFYIRLGIADKLRVVFSLRVFPSVPRPYILVVSKAGFGHFRIPLSLLRRFMGGGTKKNWVPSEI